MEDILQELKEIKELLRIIAGNTEQKKLNGASLAQAIADEASRRIQELDKEIHKEI